MPSVQSAVHVTLEVSTGCFVQVPVALHELTSSLGYRSNFSSGLHAIVNAFQPPLCIFNIFKYEFLMKAQELLFIYPARRTFHRNLNKFTKRYIGYSKFYSLVRFVN